MSTGQNPLMNRQAPAGSVSKPTQPTKVEASPIFKTPEFTGEAKPSIIPGGFSHLVFATGFRGTGKTHFIVGIDRPENVLMLDYESKGESVAASLGLKNYFSVMGDCAETLGFNFRPISIYERTKQIIEAIPVGRFTTLLLDNASLLQEGTLAEVQRAPQVYGIDPQKAANGSYGGAWPGVKYILRSLFSLARIRGIKVIGVTFQLSGAWRDGKPLFNKFKTTDVSIWHEMSILTVVMVIGLPRNIPKPSALVMKEQLASAIWSEEKQVVEVQRRVPFKLPIGEMGEVYRYLKEPVDFKNLKEGEMPELGELDPFTPTFSKEQLAALEKIARVAEILDRAETGGQTEEGG